MTAVPSPEGARGAEPAPGSERRLERARDLVFWWETDNQRSAGLASRGDLIDRLAAALARAEADIREAWRPVAEFVEAIATSDDLRDVTAAQTVARANELARKVIRPRAADAQMRGERDA